MSVNNGNFIIKGCNNEKFESNLIEYLQSKKSNIFLSLGVTEDNDKFNIDIYDTPEVLLADLGLSNFPYKLGDVSGFFGSHGVRCYLNFSKEEKYDYYKRAICHEYVHVVYAKFVQERSNNSRVVWFDEGIAQYLSGEKHDLEDNDKFKEWFNDRIISKKKIIPPIEFLYNHGNKYGNFVDQETNKYNGYDLSYLMIRYLFETTNLDELHIIMRNKNRIIEIGKSLLIDSINYYKCKLEKQSKYI